MHKDFSNGSLSLVGFSHSCLWLADFFHCEKQTNRQSFCLHHFLIWRKDTNLLCRNNKMAVTFKFSREKLEWITIKVRKLSSQRSGFHMSWTWLELEPTFGIGWTQTTALTFSFLLSKNTDHLFAHCLKNLIKNIFIGIFIFPNHWPLWISRELQPDSFWLKSRFGAF